MSEFEKFGYVEKKLDVDEGEMTLINRQSLRKLDREEVYAFRFVGCDTRVDRDHEHFTPAALGKLAQLSVGRPVLRDHNWSADTQTARIYAAAVEPVGNEERLVLRAYMARNGATEATIQAIDAGILREVSVGCGCGSAVCGICGNDKTKTWCEHVPGQKYNGKTCTVALDDVRDAYEFSFVAVPAQKGAGTVKAYGGEDCKPQAKPPAQTGDVEKELELLALEEKRY